MRKFVSALALIAAFGMAAPMAQAQGKVGVINLPKLFASAPQAEAARRELQREFGARQRSLQAREEDMLKEKERIERDAPVMKASELDAAKQKLLDKQKDFRRDAEDLQDAVGRRQRELFSSLQKGIGESLVDLAKKDGFDVVLGDGVLWARESVDITDRLLEILQAEYGESGK